jgi:hypothetical protein
MRLAQAPCTGAKFSFYAKGGTTKGVLRNRYSFSTARSSWGSFRAGEKVFVGADQAMLEISKAEIGLLRGHLRVCATQLLAQSRLAAEYDRVLH